MTYVYNEVEYHDTILIIHNKEVYNDTMWIMNIIRKYTVIQCELWT